MDHPEGIAYHGPLTLTAETLPELLARVESPPPVVSIDTETISLKDRTCIGLGTGLGPDEAVYFRVLPDPSPYYEVFQSIVCNPNIVKVYHNALFDLDVLSSLAMIMGWPEVDASNIADTSIAGRVQGLESSLEALSLRVLDMVCLNYKEVVPARHTGLDVPWTAIARKCLIDCLATRRLYDGLF